MSTLQAMLFDKKYWTLDKAKDFMKKHNIEYIKIHETKNKYRFRVKEPIEENEFRIKHLPHHEKDIEAVIMYNKKR